MRITASKRFKKRYNELPASIREKLDRQEARFIENPFHPSLHTEKLRPKSKEVWSFRVDLHYRVAFVFLEPDHVYLLTVRTHDHLYQDI